MWALRVLRALVNQLVAFLDLGAMSVLAWVLVLAVVLVRLVDLSLELGRLGAGELGGYVLEMYYGRESRWYRISVMGGLRWRELRPEVLRDTWFSLSMGRACP